MIRSVVLAVALAVAAPSLGCVASAGVEVETVATPRLVWVAPGVWLVENYDRPVYYWDSSYWWFGDGYWYRSSYYNDGFVRVGVAPAPVVRIYRPRRHVRYHAPRGVRVRKIDRNHRRPKTRDHTRRRRK